MAHDDLSTERSWSTDKSYHEVLELLPHVRALGFSRVWILEDQLPIDVIERVDEGCVRYNDMVADIKLSTRIEDPGFPPIEIACIVDVVDRQNLRFHDRVEWLLKNLPEKPGKQLRRMVRTWMKRFQRDVDSAQTNADETVKTLERMRGFLDEKE
jgi:hypothetical protein